METTTTSSTSTTPVSETSMEPSNTTIGKTRPKRRATNSHKYRYLQTRNPTRLEVIDLRKALEASMESRPSSVSGTTNTTSTTSSNKQNCPNNYAVPQQSQQQHQPQQQQQREQQQQQHHHHNQHQNRFKPVFAQRNIYHEADFWHDGIMELIEYELGFHQDYYTVIANQQSLREN